MVLTKSAPHETDETWVYAQREPDGWIQAFLWYASAIFACLFIALINNGALYYFDTAGYLAHGQAAFNSMGLFLPDPVASTDVGAATQAKDDVVIASRSAIYSALVVFARFTTGINAMVLVNTGALLLSVWLAARVASRLFLHGRSVAATTAIPVLVASLGSLPFYTAYLMPDIFAPILIMTGATLAIFARDMTKWEIILALLLGLAAVVTHPSHLIIAALLIPVVAIASLAMARPKWWLAPLLVGLITLGGLAERQIFAQTVKSVKSSEVTYQPFLTARLIADGPGLSVLDQICPDEDTATCALHEALQNSDDPWRLTASHIMFETDPSLGSYKLLPLEDQRKVAEEQVSFFLKVLAKKPIALTTAFLGNTLKQANLFSIQYTIPTEQTLINVNAITDIAPESFENIRLLGKRDAISWLTVLHGIVYAVSALLVVVIVVLPQKAPPLAFRGFAMVILIGILVNAFVCGGISQPSDRYGARVAFLLPIATSFILLFYSGVRTKRTEDLE